MRKWVVVFFILNFVLLLIWISGLPQQTFELLGTSLIHSSLMALALILLSFWVWKDEEEIEKLNDHIDMLYSHVRRIEEALPERRDKNRRD